MTSKETCDFLIEIIDSCFQIQRTVEVLLAVHKFLDEIRSAGRDHIAQKFNVDKNKGGVFPLEAFSDKVVFEVVPDFEKGGDFIVAMKFKRSESGSFDFTETLKVKRVTTFVAEGTQVTKALGMGAWTPEPALFSGVV